MSFLNELKKRKDKLKSAETVVTSVDGTRFVERGNSREIIKPSTYGFIVDTKPDDTPIMIRKFLYIGSQDCAASNVIQTYNIKHVLSLGIDITIPNVNHNFIECLDLPETSIKSTLIEGLPFVHNAIELRENVLVHCNAGVSRTAMLTIAYLMHYDGKQFEDAYSLVKEKRPAVQPNAGFRKQLQVLIPGNVI